MALVYFDASAFVKLVVEEDGSDLAADLWNGCDAALSSRLTYPEVSAALAAAARDRRITGPAFDEAQAAWDELWATTRPVELTAAVEQAAGGLARTHALGGADAVHLASALAVGSAHLVLAVWDHRLHAGAAAAGLAVAPATVV